MLYKDVKGVWELTNLKSLKVAGGVMYSCYYRMENFEGELLEEEKLLHKVQEYILTDEKGEGKGYNKIRRKRGARIDRLFFVDDLFDDRLTDEELEVALDKLT